MLNILTSADVPDGTYFRTADADVDLTEDTLTILNGRGTRRFWGSPQITSTIIVNNETLCSVHVGYSHKHGGGQFWRHFVNRNGAWVPARWVRLTNEERETILIASYGLAPSWARGPGALKGTAPTRAYKIVRIWEDKMLSVYDDSTEYVLGKRLTEAAQPNHKGGFYAYESLEKLHEAWAAGRVFSPSLVVAGVTYVLIEVELTGRRIAYDNGKCASTHIKPVKKLATLSVQG